MDLMKWDKANRAIVEATSFDEVKEIRDRAQAILAYKKQVKDSLENQNTYAEYKIRCERRMGEMLRENISKGGNPKSHDVTLDDIGITKMQSHRYQTMTDLPEEDFVQHIATVKEKEEELTSVGVYREARKKQETDKNLEIQNLEVVEPNGKFKTIVVDPPWPVKKILRDDRPNQTEFDYPTMTEEELFDIPVFQYADENCHLFLWTTHKFLPLGLQMVEHWGFKYQCLLTWVKNVGFTPFSWMYSTEHVLFARKGNLDLLKLGERLDFEGKVREHSRKPDEFYSLVERVSPALRLDMFSREKHSGFEQYGLEVEKFNIAE
jgi:N6-adenosine-specific RNA methylase IME4